MSDPTSLYTYRNGEKLYLHREPNQFVVRGTPEALAEAGFREVEEIAPNAVRVVTQPGRFESEMARARAIAPTHHVYRMADEDQDFLITDRVYILFRDPRSDVEVSEFLARYGLLLVARYNEREVVAQLTDATGMNPVKLVVRLTEEEPEVEVAENDLTYRMQPHAVVLPTDPAYLSQWHLHLQAQNPDIDPRSCSRCEQAWHLLDGFGSPGIVVGVTDDGCRLDHRDFNGPEKFAGWAYSERLSPGSLRQFRLVSDTDLEADPARMYQAGSNHGTSCAGVIGAEVDGVATVGAAPGCRLLPIKWISSGGSLYFDDTHFREVLDYLADKVDVLSNSWGTSPSNLFGSQVVSRIRELAQTGGRRGKGILFLFAAGNENCPIQFSGDIDIPYTSGWDEVNPNIWVGVRTSRRFRHNLVGIPGVLHIAALASTAQRSHYSCYGTGIDLCAPSNNSHDYRRLAVRGLGITTATGGQIGSVTAGFGGTSSATPLVAGIAALVLSADAELTAIETASLLMRTAARDLNNTGYRRTPAATFDPDTSWDVSPVTPFDQPAFETREGSEIPWSPWFGHGKVDAEAAVQEARAMRAAREEVGRGGDPLSAYLEPFRVAHQDLAGVFFTDTPDRAACQRHLYKERTDLQPVEVDGEYILYASPDSTYAVTRQLILAAQRSVGIGIYDFTAPYVRDLLARKLEEGVGVTLLLDMNRREGEAEIFDSLHELGAETERAPSCNGGRRPFFTNAHQKVIVVDSKWTLVQSGNYSHSSIPRNEGDGVSTAGLAFRPGNRDMGIAIHSAPLAAFFTDLLRDDIALERGEARAADRGAEQYSGEEADVLFARAPAQRPERLFPSLQGRFSRPVRITPVLSPENYADIAAELLRGARRTLYIEQQYIRATQPTIRALLAAIAEAKSDHRNLDVRIILAPPRGADDVKKLERDLDAMREFGLHAGKHVRVLSPDHFVSCHNKLLIADHASEMDAVTLVGSQNWSTTAVTENREVSLRIPYAPISAYFAEIFLSDWNTALHPEKAEPLRAFFESRAVATGGVVRLDRGDFEEV